jgi:hypothetical protein
VQSNAGAKIETPHRYARFLGRGASSYEEGGFWNLTYLWGVSILPVMPNTNQEVKSEATRAFCDLQKKLPRIWSEVNQMLGYQKNCFLSKPTGKHNSDNNGYYD